MSRPTLGEQELALLRFVADNAPITVGEAASRFGAEQGWARTTVLTVMERLRQKGYLVREQENGVYRYAPTTEKTEMLRGLVQNFIDRTLGGTISPFVAYLAESKRLSRGEVDALTQIVESWEAGSNVESKPPREAKSGPDDHAPMQDNVAPDRLDTEQANGETRGASFQARQCSEKGGKA